MIFTYMVITPVVIFMKMDHMDIAPVVVFMNKNLVMDPVVIFKNLGHVVVTSLCFYGKKLKQKLNCFIQMNILSLYFLGSFGKAEDKVSCVW